MQRDFKMIENMIIASKMSYVSPSRQMKKIFIAHHEAKMLGNRHYHVFLRGGIIWNTLMEHIAIKI